MVETVERLVAIMERLVDKHGVSGFTLLLILAGIVALVWFVRPYASAWLGHQVERARHASEGELENRNRASAVAASIQTNTEQQRVQTEVLLGGKKVARNYLQAVRLLAPQASNQREFESHIDRALESLDQ